MGEDRCKNISFPYKGGGSYGEGGDLKGTISSPYKRPLTKQHPLHHHNHTTGEGGGRLSKRDVSCYSTMLYHVPSIFTLPFFRRGAWVTETPASKFLSCSGTCSHGRGPSCIKLTMSVISVSSSFIDFIV